MNRKCPFVFHALEVLETNTVYVYDRTISSGTYGWVVLCKGYSRVRNPNRAGSSGYSLKPIGKTFALKIVDANKILSDPVASRRFNNECEITGHINHPGVIRSFTQMATSLESTEKPGTQHDVLILVMEFFEGPELLALIKDGPLGRGLSRDGAPETERAARIIFRRICRAVAHLHSKFIIHRDIKAENVLVDDDFNIKIVDLGYGKKFTPGVRHTSPLGTLFYASPEVLDTKNGYVGPEVDAWSLGVLLYCMLFRTFPFYAEKADREIDEVAVASKIRRDRLRFPTGFCVSSEAIDMISSLLDRNPGNRLLPADAVNHPWLKRY